MAGLYGGSCGGARGGSAYPPRKRAGPVPIHPAYLLHFKFGIQVGLGE